jgi:type III restriction enzyme
MVRRVLRDFGSKKNIVVLNDEAHHCYRRRAEAEDDEATLKGEETEEAKKRNEEARIWISGLEAVKAKVGVKAIYDLSATPFFLRGSGYGEGTLFPWVVSDFSLVDAIEAGVVKVPRVPISDDAMDPVGPTYRELWLKIRGDLPRKGARTERVEDEPKLPAELEGALLSLYGNYEKSYRRWEEKRDTETPPVFIVVCNNTNVSRLVYRWIAGWEKSMGEDGQTIVVPGKLDVLNNERDGEWIPRPNTILIDSAELDSGETLSPEFKRAAAVEISEFKDYLRQTSPGVDIEKISDEDLLREVMNTVGKPGRLGEQIKCVVSVSMLTEGWDANTVTHILGVRAFGTQLLCEQVVGRGLRRMSYAVDENDMFTAEYAEVYGVPFSFIPASGARKDPPPARPTTRVRALDERIEKEITFPRVIGYKYEIPEGRLIASFTEESKFSLSPADVPTEVEIAAIAGEQEIHRLDDLKAQRLQTVAFTLARETLKKYFSENGDERPWLFPQLLRICRDWLEQCVTTRGNAFKQLLLLAEFREQAIDRIYRSIVGADPGPKRLKPILRPYDVLGSTRYVAFDTTKPVWTTDPDKCHISHVTGDSNWEHIVARELESIDGVDSYVKNQGLNFTIPYTNEGEERQYHPDYIVRLLQPGEDEPVNVVIEVTGQGKRDKQAKVDTARTLWIPAVNNHGGFGRWDFIEVTDPFEAAKAIRALAADKAAAKEPVGA